ncbi:MAG: hypothetical protein R3E42_02340 [Burkholderiaceae bacterium]
MTTTLFDPVQIGALHLSNRIVMAPLTRNRAPDAIPTPLMATYYTQRASAGLLITEATAISQQGQGYSDVPGLYAQEHVEGWKAVTQADSRRGRQDRDPALACGPHLPQRTATPFRQAGGALGPGGQRQDGADQRRATRVCRHLRTRALEPEEIPGIVQDYRHAALSAIAAGFDGVEIHAANGYLIDQFLKTDSNRRTDDYGGSIENRAVSCWRLWPPSPTRSVASAPASACPR